MAWLWERTNWEQFRWNEEVVIQPLQEYNRRRLEIEARLGVYGLKIRKDTLLEGLTGEIVSSADIEGERYSREEVRSSVARRLALDAGALLPQDRRVEGVVEMVLDAVHNPDTPLSRERLFHWHTLLFPEGRSGMHRIETGAWRNDREGPMRVVSGSMGKEEIHFQAPPASRLEEELKSFVVWFNTDDPSLDPVLKSALAHLRFVTIHPFEDGNGRIARAIADMQLARSENRTEAYYSVSTAIRRDRSTYYELLEETQRGDGEITPWLLWYIGCLGQALNMASVALDRAGTAIRFWSNANQAGLNERQRTILTLLLSGNFEGKLTSSKWAALAKCSQDSANRDIKALLEAGLLTKGDSGGRSTWYEMLLPP